MRFEMESENASRNFDARDVRRSRRRRMFALVLAGRDGRKLVTPSARSFSSAAMSPAPIAVENRVASRRRAPTLPSLRRASMRRVVGRHRREERDDVTTLWSSRRDVPSAVAVSSTGAGRTSRSSRRALPRRQHCRARRGRDRCTLQRIVTCGRVRRLEPRSRRRRRNGAGSHVPEYLARRRSRRGARARGSSRRERPTASAPPDRPRAAHGDARPSEASSLARDHPASARLPAQR